MSSQEENLEQRGEGKGREKARVSCWKPTTMIRSHDTDYALKQRKTASTSRHPAGLKQLNRCEGRQNVNHNLQ